MPTLDWIGKRAVVNHHREIPYRLLHCDREASAGEAGGGNLLVEGDNLQALKALLPYYAGRVKCIYIDPPYNTGNENWVYNDNVNAPEIQKWLGDTVGKEAEDLSRHDKWLCMMYPRLALLRDFLREDGAIFVSIDDNEVQNLRWLLNEIFGPARYVATFVWRRRTTSDSRNLNGVSGDHEYVICYQRGDSFRVKGQEKDLSKYTNPDDDPRGPWMSDNLTGLANAAERPNLHYELVNPKTGNSYPPHSSRGWIYGKERMLQLVVDGRILWPKRSTGRPRLKRYLSDMLTETTGYSTMLTAPGNVEATKELSRILGPKAFAFPKPTELIKRIIQQATGPDDLVLDSFAGSGTTGNAVLALNKEDGGNRRFIIVELEPKIARDITAERLKRIIAGYGDTRGLGGSFRYCTLGEPLFDAEGRLREDVKWGDLAHHLWFAESGEPWMPQFAKREQSLSTGGPMIGVAPDGRGVYLLFSSVHPDAQRNGASTLSSETLDSLAPFDGPRIVYADACTLRASALSRERIAFKQIPYQVQQQ